MGLRRLLLVGLLAAAVVAPAVAAGAQEPGSTTTVVAVPGGDIVPRPGSGSPPQEAGDRGGALQLGVLALVVLGVGGVVLGVVRQSQRARAEPPPS